MVSTQDFDFRLDLDTPQSAKAYAEVNRRFQLPAAKRLISRLRNLNGATLLDVGCGTGDAAIHAAELVGATGAVYAFDPSPDRVELAKKKLEETNAARREAGETPLSVFFQVGRAETMATTYPQNSFDHVIMSSVMHWLKDPVAVAKQANEILKPGGCFATTSGCDEEEANGRENLAQTIKQDLLAEWPYNQYQPKGLAKRLTTPALSGILTEAGLTQIDIEHDPTTFNFCDYDDFLLFAKSSTSNNYDRIGHMSEEHGKKFLVDMRSRFEAVTTESGITFPFTFIVGRAYKPGSNQHKLAD